LCGASDDNKNISNSSSNSAASSVGDGHTQKLNGGINTLDPYYITGFADGAFALRRSMGLLHASQPSYASQPTPTYIYVGVS